MTQRANILSKNKRKLTHCQVQDIKESYSFLFLTYAYTLHINTHRANKSASSPATPHLMYFLTKLFEKNAGSALHFHPKIPVLSVWTSFSTLFLGEKWCNDRTGKHTDFKWRNMFFFPLLKLSCLGKKSTSQINLPSHKSSQRKSKHYILILILQTLSLKDLHFFNKDFCFKLYML